MAWQFDEFYGLCMNWKMQNRVDSEGYGIRLGEIWLYYHMLCAGGLSRFQFFTNNGIIIRGFSDSSVVRFWLLQFCPSTQTGSQRVASIWPTLTNWIISPLLLVSFRLFSQDAQEVISAACGLFEKLFPWIYQLWKVIFWCSREVRQGTSNSAWEGRWIWLVSCYGACVLRKG